MPMVREWSQRSSLCEDGVISSLQLQKHAFSKKITSDLLFQDIRRHWITNIEELRPVKLEGVGDGGQAEQPHQEWIETSLSPSVWAAGRLQTENGFWELPFRTWHCLNIREYYAHIWGRLRDLGCSVPWEKMRLAFSSQKDWLHFKKYFNHRDF